LQFGVAVWQFEPTLAGALATANAGKAGLLMKDPAMQAATMNQSLVSESHVSVIGPAICVLDVYVAPPSAEVENSTPSWQVDVVQFATG
jgi:hypothetical protein